MNQLFKFHACWLLLTLLPACGGDSDDGGKPSTAQLVASCKRLCGKMMTCAGDAGAAFFDCDQLCTEETFTSGQGGQSSSSSCDYGKMKSKLDECEKVECAELQGCYAAAGALCSETPSGSGGSGSGVGGAGPGTGAGCDVCDKANTCCKSSAAQAGQDPASCNAFSKSTCEGYPAAQQTALIQGCSSIAAACP